MASVPVPAFSLVVPNSRTLFSWFGSHQIQLISFLAAISFTVGHLITFKAVREEPLDLRSRVQPTMRQL